MDSCAKYHLEQYHQSQVSYSNGPNHYLSFPTIKYKKDIIRDNVKDTLYHRITSDNILTAWVDKGRISNDTIIDINWEIQRKAIRAVPEGRRKFVIKWASNNLATGKNMSRWKLRALGQCPFCLSDNEDTLHILQCQHVDAKSYWDQKMTIWTKRLKKIDTSIVIRQQLKLELNAWRSKDMPPCLNHIEPDLRSAIIQQRRIGWNHFLEGLIGKELVTYMDQYYNDLKSYKNAISWGSKFIRSNWDFLFDIWTERNNQLHNTQRIKDMEGFKILINAIKAEWNIGINKLPIQQFDIYFRSGITHILHQDIEGLKHWFVTVRLARIIHKDPKLLNDEFSEKGPLATWVGLPDSS